MHAGIGIGGEPGAVLARATDDAKRALFEHRIERQDVIARNAKDVGDAVVLKPADEVLTDGKFRVVGCRHVCVNDWLVGSRETEVPHYTPRPWLIRVQLSANGREPRGTARHRPALPWIG